MGKTDAWGTGWMIVALLLLAIIIVLTSLMPPASAISSEAFWQAASAVATAGAVGVALWLGWREGRWRRESEKAQVLLAMMYAVSVRAAWDEVGLMLRGLRQVLEYGQLEGISGGDFGAKVDHCGRQLSTLDFQALSRIDAKAALQLAEVPHLLHILSVFAGTRHHFVGTKSLNLLVAKGLDLVEDIEARFERANSALFATALYAVE